MNITKLVELKMDPSKKDMYVIPHNWELHHSVDENTNYKYVSAYRYNLMIKFQNSFSCDDSRLSAFKHNLLKSLNYSLYGDLVDKLIQIKIDAANKNWPQIDDALNELIDEYTRIY